LIARWPPLLGAALLCHAALSGVVQYGLTFWLYLIGLNYLSASAAALWLTLILLAVVAGGREQ